MHGASSRIEIEPLATSETVLFLSVMCARNPAEYFADRLWKSMKGAGTDDATLIRCVVSRSEVRTLSCC